MKIRVVETDGGCEYYYITSMHTNNDRLILILGTGVHFGIAIDEISEIEFLND